MNMTRSFIRQRGASLVIGLVLLLVLSVLAVSTMSSASFGLEMVGNAQYAENAFQMAETGVDVAITQGPFTTAPGGNPPIPLTAVVDVDGDAVGTYQAGVAFTESTAPPSGGFSIGSGNGTFQACHFQINSTGLSSRAAQSVHQQEFYVVCPGGSG